MRETLSESKQSKLRFTDKVFSFFTYPLTNAENLFTIATVIQQRILMDDRTVGSKQPSAV